MVQQASIMHAQISRNSASNFGSRDSSAVIGAGRTAGGSHSAASQLAATNGGLTDHHHHHHHHLGIVGSTTLQQQHHSTSIKLNRLHKNGMASGGNSNNFPNNQHHHHLGHNSINANGRNRLAGGASPTSPSIASAAAAAAAAMALNSHFSHHVHHPFASSTTNSNATNSNSLIHHHHHPLSLASSSSNSCSSSASSTASSSPSASISPSSLAPGTPSQTGNILGANPTSSYLANSNHHYQSNINQNATNYSHVSSSTQNINNSQQQQQQQQQQNTSRYKTELCRPFEENGTCKYGEKCQFAHGMSELRTLTRHPKYKTEFCRTFHTTGFCPYGPRCHFIHNSKTPPTNQQTLSLGTYASNRVPFGLQTSHSASPSTSPISSTSSATTTNGSSSSSSASPTSSSSSNNSQRMLDAMTGFQYGGRLTTPGLFGGGPIDSSSQVSNELDQTGLTYPEKPSAMAAAAVASLQRRNENDETNSKGQAAATGGCTKETQRLLWIHSQMNESSRWPPAMCASGLISSNANNSRRTWQMQA